MVDVPVPSPSQSRPLAVPSQEPVAGPSRLGLLPAPSQTPARFDLALALQLAIDLNNQANTAMIAAQGDAPLSPDPFEKYIDQTQFSPPSGNLHEADLHHTVDPRLTQQELESFTDATSCSRMRTPSPQHQHGVFDDADTYMTQQDFLMQSPPRSLSPMSPNTESDSAGSSGEVDTNLPVTDTQEKQEREDKGKGKEDIEMDISEKDVEADDEEDDDEDDDESVDLHRSTHPSSAQLVPQSKPSPRHLRSKAKLPDAPISERSGSSPAQDVSSGESEVDVTVAKPVKPLKSHSLVQKKAAQPGPTPGMQYIMKDTLEGNLNSHMQGPMTMMDMIVTPVGIYLLYIGSYSSLLCTDDYRTLLLQILWP